MQAFTKQTYQAAIADLRNLLALLGRADFKLYGYAKQLRHYRQMAAVPA